MKLNYKIWLYLLSSVVLLMLAPFASAQVIINEIAWMGTQNSANDEWIELYNSGSTSVDLNGWLIEATDGTPSIDLSGSISAGDYFLLERTDDSSMPSVSADLIYTGALGNSGEVLSLKDNNAIEVHKVDGGNGWPAGDNNTKETMQWNGSSWITAPSTPKAVNSGVGGGGTSGGSQSAGGTSSSETEKEEPQPEPKITSQIIIDSIVVAGVAVEFDSVILGYSGETLTIGKYFWNFGDLTTMEDKKGQKFKHTYFYPGDYVVILDYYRNYYAREPDATDRRSIKVIPAEISISSVEREAVSGGDGQGILIEIFNGSTYEIDLSQWTLQSDLKFFSVPKNTIILPSKRLIFSSRVTGFTEVDNSNLRLLYPGGEIAFVYTESETEPESLVESLPAIPASLGEAGEADQLAEEPKSPSGVDQPSAEDPEPLSDPQKIVYISDKVPKLAQNTVIPIPPPPALHTAAALAMADPPAPRLWQAGMSDGEEVGDGAIPSSLKQREDQGVVEILALETISFASLQAGVAVSLDQEEKGNSKLYLWLTALMGLILVAGSATFLLRKKPSDRYQGASNLTSEEIEIID